MYSSPLSAAQWSPACCTSFMIGCADATWLSLPRHASLKEQIA
jgi:hypothetical protein